MTCVRPQPRFLTRAPSSCVSPPAPGSPHPRLGCRAWVPGQSPQAAPPPPRTEGSETAAWPAGCGVPCGAAGARGGKGARQGLLTRTTWKRGKPLAPGSRGLTARGRAHTRRCRAGGERAPARRAWPGMPGHMLAHGAHGTFLLGAGGRGPRCERPQRAPGAIMAGRAHLVTSEVWLPAAPHVIATATPGGAGKQPTTEWRPLTPGRPLKGVGRPRRHRQVWEKKLAAWLGSSRDLGPGCPCPVPCPAQPQARTPRRDLCPGGWRGGRWAEEARHPQGSGSPSMLQFVKSGAQATGNPSSGGPRAIGSQDKQPPVRVSYR